MKPTRTAAWIMALVLLVTCMLPGMALAEEGEGEPTPTPEAVVETTQTETLESTETPTPDPAQPVAPNAAEGDVSNYDDPSISEPPPSDDPSEPTPENTPTLTPEDTPTPTPDPEKPIPPANWGVGLSEFTMPHAMAGETVSFGIPVAFYIKNDIEWATNMREGQLVTGVPVATDIDPRNFSDEILNHLTYVKVTIKSGRSDMFDLSSDIAAVVIGNAAENNEWGFPKDALYNLGFAWFENIPIKQSATSGQINLEIEYRSVYGINKTIPATVEINITAAPSTPPPSSGGGGGSGYSGGGGGGGSRPKPQAKLFVTDITTNPDPVKAGQEFDLYLTIWNTSVSQYVQNLKVTVTAQDDVFLPISGSNTTYIPRIDADDTFDLHMRVRARVDAPDAPVRVDVVMEFEDQAVSSQSENQQLMLSILPVFRVQVEDPIPGDMGTSYVFQTHMVKLQVMNLGKITMFNTIVTVRSDNPDLMAAPPFFIGNMEGGSNKIAEIDLFPMAEGSFEVTFVVTYENADGVEDFVERTYSFYANPEPDYSYMGLPEPTPEPEEVDPLAIVRLMPWWLYAALGGLIVLIVIALGSGARARRRKALEDDEME